CVDGMPFMPEMLQFCGRQFHVAAVAHKACDTSHGTWKNRRLQSAVALAGLRCDGSAHGGCQAECLILWKDVWLRSAAKDERCSSAAGLRNKATGCTESELLASVYLPLTI